MKGEIDLHTKISLDDLIQELAEMSNEHLVQLIKELDQTCACYEFTKELRDFFVSEMEKEERNWEIYGDAP